MSSDNFFTVRRDPADSRWVVSMGFASSGVPECKTPSSPEDRRFEHLASALDHAFSQYSEYGVSEDAWCADLPAGEHIPECRHGERLGLDPRDLDADGTVDAGERVTVLRRAWSAAPRSLRRVLVAIAGSTLVLLGLLLVVLPGPFTAPLVILGLVVLASEFAWAARTLERGRAGLAQARRRLRRQEGPR